MGGGVIWRDRLERSSPLLLAGLVFLVFARTFEYGLYLDDHHFVRPWTVQQVAGAFHGPFDPQGIEPPYFRPFVGVSFAIDWAIWGFTEWGYHLTNVTLHALSTIAVFKVLQRVKVPWWAAIVGAVYFAVVPSNAATAIYIAERSDAMAAILVCLGLIELVAYHRSRKPKWLVLLAATYVAALCAKEVGVALAPFVAVFWLYLRVEDLSPSDASRSRLRLRDEARVYREALIGRDGRKSWTLVLSPMLAISAGYLLYRQSALGPGAFGSRFAETRDPVTGLAIGVRDTFKGVPWEVSALSAPVLVCAFVVAFVLRPRAQTLRVVLLGFVGVVAGCLPLSFSGGFDPRLLYVAEIGMAIAVAGVAMSFGEALADKRADKRRMRGVAAVVCTLGAVVCATTVITQIQSQNEYRPGSAKKLGADLKIWSDPIIRPQYDAHWLARIEVRLREAGMIDDEGEPVGT